MPFPEKISVSRGGAQVFVAEAGRGGFADSACRDFACYASPIIGAAYTHTCFVEAAKRIADLEYSTMIEQGGNETCIAATHGI